MALFGQDAPDPRIASGFAALGDLVAGGPQQRAQGAYVDQIKKHGQAADAMWQASDSRARAIARAGITADVVKRAQAGDVDAQAALGASALGTAASPNLSNITGGLGDFADMEIDRQRADALKAGNVPSYNQLTALRKDKDYQPVRIEDGVMLGDGVALDDATVIPLPQTLATIEQREAQTQRTRAGITNDQRRTQAAVDRANRPPAPRSSGGKAASGDAAVLEQARQRVADGADPRQVADYLIRKGYPGVAKKLYAPK